MSFEQLIAILRARWLIAISAFVLIASAVAIYTLLVPKQYTASGSVVVDIRSPDPVAGAVLPGVTQPSFLMTQIDIMTSTRVAHKVVRDMQLSSSPDMVARWKAATKGVGDYEFWVGELIRKSVEARPSRGSNVINVSYTAADPKFAAAIVNAFIKGYLDTDREMRTQPAKQFNEQFDSTAKEMRARVEDAQKRLSSFLQEQELIVSDERLDIETARLNQLSSELVSMQSALVDSGSRQSAAQNRMDQSPDIMANPLLNSLRSDIIHQENALEAMRSRLGDQHPQVQELVTNLNELRRKLDTETKRVASSVGVSNSVNSSRVVQIKRSLDDQRAKVLKMKNIRDQADGLQREIDVARRALDGVTARMQNAGLESKAQSNLAQLETAAAPSYPSSPRVFSNMSMGGVVAAIVALALVLLIEARDRRLRTLNEVESGLNLPLLGAIPTFKKQAKAKDRVLGLPLVKAPVKALTHSA
jgi:succinoglycan biosynthesis transport protein ExoP